MQVTSAVVNGVSGVVIKWSDEQDKKRCRKNIMSTFSIPPYTLVPHREKEWCESNKKILGKMFNNAKKMKDGTIIGFLTDGEWDEITLLLFFIARENFHQVERYKKRIALLEKVIESGKTMEEYMDEDFKKIEDSIHNRKNAN